MRDKKICFVIAILATFGSLFFSEVMKLPPCKLCWFQRICMYPLLLVYGSAIWTQDEGYIKYEFPLIGLGLAISLYHNLLYYSVIADSLVPCSEGVSCTSKQIELFGFLTIPLLALISFSLIFLVELFGSLNRRTLYEK